MNKIIYSFFIIFLVSCSLFQYSESQEKQWLSMLESYNFYQEKIKENKDLFIETEFKVLQEFDNNVFELIQNVKRNNITLDSAIPKMRIYLSQASEIYHEIQMRKL